MKKKTPSVAIDASSQLRAKAPVPMRYLENISSAIITIVGKYVPTWLKSSARCKLCWRITFAIFASILLIESAILVPSALRFVEADADQLRDSAISAVEAAITLDTPSLDPGSLESVLARLIGHRHVVGLTARTENGQAVAQAREALETGRDATIQASPWTVLSYFESGTVQRREFRWKLQNFSPPLFVTVRLDTTKVNKALRSYVPQ